VIPSLHQAASPLAYHYYGGTWGYNATIWTYNNGADLLRIGFGAFDVVAGIGIGLAGSATGIGLPAGIALGTGLATIGIDQIITGIMNLGTGLRTGSAIEYVGSSAAYKLGFNEGTPEFIGGMLPGVLSIGIAATPWIVTRMTRGVGPGVGQLKRRATAP